MKKTDLITTLFERLNRQVPKRLVTELVDGVFENAAGAIRKDGRFSFPGFGTFVIRKRKARKGRNPQTGEAIKIKASRSVGFRAAKAFKERL